MRATLLPKLRVHFAEFLSNASSVGLRILSSSTCVGLGYGHILNNSGFSRRPLRTLRYFRFAPHHAFALHGRFAPHTAMSLAPGFPFPARALFPCPHSSVSTWCRNIHLLSIGYASPPGLRPRLAQGRSALPWIPWIFGLGDSHPHLATHSGILSSQQSTTPFGMASARCQCSPTNHINAIPELRCRVSAPVIFGAGPLG